MKGIIIVLGAPNNENGELSTIARERCEQAIEEYRRHPDYKFLLTGGYGAHFNTTAKPHAYYTRHYLISRHIPKQDILERVESSNTLEDARLSHPIVKRYGVKHVIVVSSDFHLDRAQYIFFNTFQDIRVSFSESYTDLPQQEVEALKQHEQRALRKLREGFLFCTSCVSLDTSPQPSPNRGGSEGGVSSIQSATETDAVHRKSFNSKEDIMTDVEKLGKIKDLLHEYKDNESIFAQPANETEQQKQFREDLRMVVSLVFKDDLEVPSNLSVAELKERMRKIWEKTKPEAWK